jgi:hypothetical protein
VIHTEAQRTLIKSPLELWEELSDPASLAHHLGEFGEIRITRIRNERALEWEADRLSGTIELSPSGWGTRVTLTVAALEAQNLASPQTAEEPQPASEQSGRAESPLPAEAAGPDRGTAESPLPAEAASPDTGTGTADTALPAEAADPQTETSGREPGPGFLARLFRLLHRARNANEDQGAESREPAPNPSSDRPPETQSELAAPVAEGARRVEVWLQEIEDEGERSAIRVKAAPSPPGGETITDERAEAVLLAALDRLGAAHHRPFSRA